MNNEEINKLLIEIWRDFYRYRNGVIAESLKKMNQSFPMIFGLLINQITEISKKYPKNITLSTILWKGKKSRESRLLSLYLLPTNEIDKETIKDFIKDIQTTEEADIISFRVLRYIPYANDLYLELASKMEEEDISDLQKYLILMFKKNLN